jgi:hypothetical protein
MPKVRELRGIPAFHAFQAFQKVMLGLKMLPAYAAEGFEEFYARVEKMPFSDQETLIREAVALGMKLDPEEIMDLLQFVEDPNGICYGPAQIKSLDPPGLHEALVAVCCELAKLKINLVSQAEKKN